MFFIGLFIGLALGGFVMLIFVSSFKSWDEEHPIVSEVEPPYIR